MLADQKNRDEIIAYDGHIFIVAGAGTGKSTIIADKLLWLLETGKLQHIKNIAAITYTNKAAAELKWKIEEKLFLRINEVKSKETAAVLKEALNSIHESSIGTIHSFCVRLLHKYGYREKIDPMFSIASKEESNVMLYDAFSLYISRIIHEDTEISNIWKELILSGNYDSLESLLNDVESIIEKAHFLEDTSAENFPIKNSDDLKRFQTEVFKEHVQRFSEYLQYYNYSEEASVNINSLGGKLDSLNRILLHEDNPLERIKLYNADIQPGKYRGSKDYIMDSSPYEKTQDILKQYLLLFSNYPFHESYYVDDKFRQHFISNIFPEYSGITMHTLNNEYSRYLFYRALRDVHDYFMNYKKEKSMLSYNDIIYYSNKILNNQTILHQVQKQYKYIFVDEYQDTDPVQTSIFTKMADSIYVDKPARANLEYSPLKLIRVGDAKQSIYSFRGADLETFHREKEKFNFHESGHIGHLTVNMRSHPRLITFINRVFTQISKSTPMDIVNYESIIAGTQKSRLSDPGVYINHFSSSTENDSTKIKTKRKSEALWLASEIETLFALNKDLTICILFLSMKDNLEPYVSQLKEKNIPYSLVGRRYYGENFTKRYITLFFKYLYNINDKISLTGFLRSPVAGFTDLEVESVMNPDYITKALQNETINLENFNSELLLRIDKIVELIKSCMLLARNHSLPDMLFYLFDHSSFLPFTDLLYNSEIIKESMDRFLEIAVSTENLSFLTFNEKLGHFIEEIEKLENIPEVDESVEAYSHQNSVQIMSYHKSKGLEFDVVFMADLAYTKNNRSEKLILEPSRETSGVLFQYKDDLSCFAIDGNEVESILNRKKKEEMVRLAYVAMTRAKERLYLPIHDSLKKGECLLNYFYETLVEKFQFNREAQEHVDDWISTVYDTDFEDSIYFIKYYNAPEVDEDHDDEYRELNTIQSDQEIKKNESLPSPSYTFISGTSIMKKLAVEKGIHYDKIYEKPAEGNMEEELIHSDEDTNDDIQTTNRHNKESVLADALTRGVIAHSVFELTDLKNPAIHDGLLEALFYAHAFNIQARSDIEKYAHELVDTYKKSKLFTLVNSSLIIGKEIPFSQLFGDDEIDRYLSQSAPNPPNQQQIAVGYMDLVLKDSNHIIHIIDYKTNVKPQQMPFSDFFKHLIETYDIPMRLYENTIKHIFPETRIILTLYHTVSGECISYPDFF